MLMQAANGLECTWPEDMQNVMVTMTRHKGHGTQTGEDAIPDDSVVISASLVPFWGVHCPLIPWLIEVWLIHKDQ